MKTTRDFTHKGTAALHCLGMPKKDCYNNFYHKKV